MKPIYFKQANRELTKPESMTDDECSSLHVFTNGKECISCWQMSWRERLSALLFGRVWLWVVSGKTQPPVGLEARGQLFKEVNHDPQEQG